MQFQPKLRGFSLAELMVVVAIVALFSAIVLVSLNKSREKSEASALIQQVDEYVTALQLAYGANGNKYPWNGASTLAINQRGCLVNTTGSGGCQHNGSVLPVYPDLDPLGDMITVQPIDPPVIDDQGHVFDGVLYATNGSAFWLDYPMKGELSSDEECGVADAEIFRVGGSQYPGITICRYESR